MSLNEAIKALGDEECRLIVVTLKNGGSLTYSGVVRALGEEGKHSPAEYRVRRRVDKLVDAGLVIDIDGELSVDTSALKKVAEEMARVL